MIRKSMLLRVLLVMALLGAGLLLAQTAHEKPVMDVNAQRNPNLAQAQKLCNQAFEEITKAQKDNKYDMKGHAAKAKELIAEATHELSEADKIADSTTPGKAGNTGNTNHVSGLINKVTQ